MGTLTHSDDITTRMHALTLEGDTEAARGLLAAARRRGETDLGDLAASVLVDAGEWSAPLEWYLWRVARLDELRKRAAKACTAVTANSSPGTKDIHVDGSVQIGARILVNSTQGPEKFIVEDIPSDGVIRVDRFIACDIVTGDALTLLVKPIDCHALCNALFRINKITDSWPDRGYGDPFAQRMYYAATDALDMWWSEWQSRWKRSEEMWDCDVPECICLEAGVERGLCPADCYEGGVVETLSSVDYLTPGSSDLAELTYATCVTCDGTGRCQRCGQ